MHFPRYWVRSTVEGINQKGEKLKSTCWGWSDNSLAEAEQVGRDRAGRVLERLLGGTTAGGHYPYDARPMREEVLQQIKGDDGNVEAVITRNSYGCRVLNTSSAMFVDIDFQEKDPRESFGAKLKSLFGQKGPTEDPRESKMVADLENKLGGLPRTGARLYRTKAGIRVLFTHEPAEPGSDTTVRLMESLGADPLYIRLCKTQECFRARLSPKPWRCGLVTLHDSYPWMNEKIRTRFEQWERKYTSVAESFATCRFIKQIGSSQTHSSLLRIVSLHDRESKANSDLKLA